MKKISFLLVCLMAISLWNVSALTNWEENYNAASANVALGTSGFTFVAHPNGTEAVDTAPVADGAGVDRAFMSGQLDNKYAETSFGSLITGKVVLEGQFRVESRPIPSPNSYLGVIKFFDVYSSAGSSVFALTTGTISDTGYQIRPLYHNGSANVTSSVTFNGGMLSYKQWYTMKAVLDVTNGTVTMYVDNIKVVDNMYFWGKVIPTALQKVRSGHANGGQFSTTNPNSAHIAPFLIDNLKLYDYVADATVSSGAYTVGAAEITEIPKDTSVETFLANLTFSQGGSGAVYYADGVTPKTTGIISRGDILILTPGNKNYVLKLNTWEFEESFNSIIDNNISIGSGWKKIARPADGITVDYATEPEIPDNGGANRALLSATAPDQSKIIASLGDNVSGGVKIEMDFRMESADTTAVNGNIKFAEIFGKNVGESAEEVIFGVTSGTYTSDSFRLRPVFGISAGLGSIGPSLAYKTWHHLEILLDTDIDLGSIYVDNQPVILGAQFYNRTAEIVTKVQSYNNKNTVITPYILDNFKISQAVMQSFAVSSVYTVDNAAGTISNIPYPMPVSELLNNITFTKSGSYGEIIDNQTGLVKSTGTVNMGDKFVIMPENTIYKLMYEGFITYDDFNSDTWGSGWTLPVAVYSQVGRPSDSDLTVVPDPDNKAMLAQDGNSTSAKMGKYTLNAQGDLEISMDFLIKQSVAESTLNQVKLCEIIGTDGATTRTAVNVSVTSSFTLTYSNGTSYAARLNKPVTFGKWHTLKVVASTDLDKTSVWLDGTLVADKYNFQGISSTDATPSKVDKFSEMRIYHATTNTTPGLVSPYYFDNVSIRYLSNNAAVTSSTYTVNSDVISDVLKNTSTEDFLVKLKLPSGSSAAIYSEYNTAIPGNSTLRTGNVENGDKLVVTAENGWTYNIYTIEVVPNVSVYYTNQLGVKVDSLSLITDNKISAAADIINKGINNDKGEFVIIIAAYSDSKLLSAKYSTYTLPVSEVRQTIKVEAFDIPSGSTKLAAFVWNKFGEMIPLGAPVEIK